MKGIRFFILASLMSMFLSCVKAKKNVSDYYAKARIVSVNYDSNGDVTVEGEVDLDRIDKKDTVFFVGVCNDTVPEPKRNLIYIKLPTSKSFTIQYYNHAQNFSYQSFKKNKTYYFRTLTVNTYGYEYGKDVRVDDIRPYPVVAPCNLSPNFVDLGLENANATVPTFTLNSNVINIKFKDVYNLDLTFSSDPEPRTYKVAAGSIWEKPAGSVQVYYGTPYNGGWQNATVPEGGLVYVNETSDPALLEVTLCNLAWTSIPDKAVHYINARFLVKR